MLTPFDASSSFAKPTADCRVLFCYHPGMSKRSVFSPFADVLGGVARRLGLESKLLEARLRRDWPAIVGEAIAANTRPDQIRFKKLYLSVHNSVWMHQLNFLKPTLLEKVNNAAGTELITDIILRIGDLSGPPPPLTSALAHGGPPGPGEDQLAEAAAHTIGVRDPDIRGRLTALIAQAPSGSRDRRDP